MKALSVLSNLPELQSLAAPERTKIIRRWQREVDRPWSGYLAHTAFGLLLALPIIIAQAYFIPRSIGESYHVCFLSFAVFVGWIGGNALHNRFVVLPRRDILHRLLEQHEPTL